MLNFFHLRTILLISLSFLIASCSQDTQSRSAIKETIDSTNRNIWVENNANKDSITKAQNHDYFTSRLTTQVNVSSGRLELSLQCSKNLVSLRIMTDTIEFSTSPVYSKIDDRWAHSFIVYYMSKVGSIMTSTLARNDDFSMKLFVVTGIDPVFFLNPEFHINFQTRSKVSVPVFFDERVRMFAKSCGTQH